MNLWEHNIDIDDRRKMARILKYIASGIEENYIQLSSEQEEMIKTLIQQLYARRGDTTKQRQEDEGR